MMRWECIHVCDLCVWLVGGDEKERAISVALKKKLVS